mgnify:FL=1
MLPKPDSLVCDIAYNTVNLILGELGTGAVLFALRKTVLSVLQRRTVLMKQYCQSTGTHAHSTQGHQKESLI